MMHNGIASQIRVIVSKKKKRYQKQGFDLDLSYVTDRIIAMGFPADNFEALYRNYIDDVSKFFEVNHDGQYKIYNLCRERSFDASKFRGEVVLYPFDDHNPPTFSVLTSCIDDIGLFLSRDARNVVAINCKAGKGRTGVIVCCSMLYSAISTDAATALTEYGRCRTHNGKGVTIPSQIRYIFYYDHYRRHNLVYRSIPLWLRLIKFEIVPNIINPELQFVIHQADSVTSLYTSKTYKISKDNRVIIFHEMLTFPMSDDLKFEFMQKSVLGISTELCTCWLNTYFVVHQPSIQILEPDVKSTEPKIPQRCLPPVPSSRSADIPVPKETVYRVSLTKQEIDKANKDYACRIFPANFAIVFLFSDTPPNSILRNINGKSSCEIGNSVFFESFSESKNEYLEARWKSTSSQFYFDCV